MSPIRSIIQWPLPVVEPEKVGTSSKRLSQIRPNLQRFINRKFAPNLMTLVARHGKIVIN